jgi:hypothetical protein
VKKCLPRRCKPWRPTDSFCAKPIQLFHRGVDYSLTVMGREAAEQIEGLAGWIEENLQRVAQARANYGKAKRPSR